MQETEIISLFFARDERALAKSEAEYGAYCAAIARNILGDAEDVKECVNDTWLKAWDTIPPQKPRSLLAYLGKITRNGAINMLRAAGRQKRAGAKYALALDELGDMADQQAEVKIAASELTATINDFLAQLPKDKRIIFVRRYFYMDAIADIAAANGATESSIKTALYRMRQKLGTELKKKKYL